MRIKWLWMSRKLTQSIEIRSFSVASLLDKHSRWTNLRQKKNSKMQIIWEYHLLHDPMKNSHLHTICSEQSTLQRLNSFRWAEKECMCFMQSKFDINHVRWVIDQVKELTQEPILSLSRSQFSVISSAKSTAEKIVRTEDCDFFKLNDRIVSMFNRWTSVCML